MNPLRTPLVVANWKMHGSLELSRAFADRLDPPDNVDVWIAPTALHVQFLVKLVHESISVGVQNVYTEQLGAFTGEVSAGLAQNAGAKFSLVGHSERRKLFNEADSEIAKKFLACVSAEITPILCVGESLEQRESGIAKEVVQNQIRSIADVCDEREFSSGVLAYEPVWAIGTGVAATPFDAQDMHVHIRDITSQYTLSDEHETRILYGGSVKESNASTLIQQNDIDGFLVGGASLDVSEFNTICRIVAEN